MEKGREEKGREREDRRKERGLKERKKEKRVSRWKVSMMEAGRGMQEGTIWPEPWGWITQATLLNILESK